MNKIKRLFFDIETSPNIGFFWTAGYKLNIGSENIIKERAIICICYKWENEKTTHFLYWDKEQNDKTLLEKFIKVANKADEIVGHNGDKFDLPWIRTRCLFHRIPMFPTYVTIDTLQQARHYFNFNSNKLDYIAKYLGLGSKIPTNYDLWKNIILNKSAKSLKEMITYCQQDVVLLEKVYKALDKYVPHRTHQAVMIGKGKASCPRCGSSNTMKNGTRTTATGIRRNRYQCKDCGGYHIAPFNAKH